MLLGMVLSLVLGLLIGQYLGRLSGNVYLMHKLNICFPMLIKTMFLIADDKVKGNYSFSNHIDALLEKEIKNRK